MKLLKTLKHILQKVCNEGVIKKKQGDFQYDSFYIYVEVEMYI